MIIIRLFFGEIKQIPRNVRGTIILPCYACKSLCTMPRRFDKMLLHYEKKNQSQYRLDSKHNDSHMQQHHTTSYLQQT